MKRMTKYLYVISLDGLSTLDFQYIATLPNFMEFLKHASYSKKVLSIYPTLTYPAHTTIVTGRYPKSHGIINNTLLQPERVSPDWYWQRIFIKGETLYDLAIKEGMKVAALLWPVTAKSKIQYNLPEIFANRPWQKQILVSLLNGTPLFQFILNSKFGALRNGIKQPNLDNFNHQALIYTINNKKPDLVLAHYTDLDSMRHIYGFSSKEAKEALDRHDKRLGEIIDALKANNIYQDTTLIILGDHSSIDENKIINLNILLKEKGYISVSSKGKIIKYTAICKSCDGSAYIYLKEKNNIALRNEVRREIEAFNKNYDCIEKIYSNKEAAAMGADNKCTLMLEAKRGYYFSDNAEGELIREILPNEMGTVHQFTRSTHGYHPSKEDYTTVFMAAGKGIKSGIDLDEMSLLDEGPTMARLLGLELKSAEGRVLEEFLE